MTVNQTPKAFGAGSSPGESAKKPSYTQCLLGFLLFILYLF